MSSPPLIIGHRGASALAPENTLAAFQMAIDAGADGIEFDVQLSKDGIPVVMHDATLERTGRRNDAVADLTALELGQVDVGSWFNDKTPDRARLEFIRETVPTLAQVLERCRPTNGLIYIELKVNVPDYASLAQAVCDVIRDSPQLGQMIVKSFKLDAITEVRSLLPNVETAALFEPSILDLIRRRMYMLEAAQDCGASQISLHYSLITRKLMSHAEKARMPITVWTADDLKWVQRCRKLGIRSLITNDPARLLSERD
jgi:glycerophosphoryl diester phosphodiesterase